MRLIKLAFISVIVFALVITFMSLFFPSHIRISKAIDINGAKDSIQHLLSDPLERKKWNPDTTLVTNQPGNRRSTSGWNIFDSNQPNTYTVQWYMDFHLRWYPWEKFSGLLLEKRYGPFMEKGLAKLKQIVEH
jgi:hypothetical protein